MVLWLVSGIPLHIASNLGAQLLVAANQQPDIFHGRGSFQLDVDFTAQLNVPGLGHLTVRWKDEDHWWMRVSLAGFEQIEIQDREWTHTARNLGFTPIRVQELMGLIHLPDHGHYRGGKWKARVQDGVRLR